MLAKIFSLKHVYNVTGVESDKLQTKDQPLWTYWLPKLCHCIPWWFPLCFRW